MNKIMRTFIVLLCGFILCGYTTTGYSNVELTIAEDYDTGYSTMNTIQIKGKYITLPCKVSLFADLGFKADQEYKVQPRHIMSNVPMYLSDGNSVELGLVNNTNNEQDWKDCDVYMLTYSHGGMLDNVIDFDISGIKGGDTYETVKAKLGEGTYTSDYDKAYGFTQSFQTAKWDREFMFGYLPDYTIDYINVEVDTPLDYEYESAFGYDDGSGYYPDEYDDYYIDDYDYPDIIGPDVDPYRDSSEGFAILGAIIIVAVIILCITVIVVICIVKSGSSRRDRARSRQNAAEIEAARRILNTDLEDLANEELGDKYGGS